MANYYPNPSGDEPKPEDEASPDETLPEIPRPSAPEPGEGEVIQTVIEPTPLPETGPVPPTVVQPTPSTGGELPFHDWSAAAQNADSPSLSVDQDAPGSASAPVPDDQTAAYNWLPLEGGTSSGQPSSEEPPIETPVPDASTPADQTVAYNWLPPDDEPSPQQPPAGEPMVSPEAPTLDSIRPDPASNSFASGDQGVLPTPETPLEGPLGGEAAAAAAGMVGAQAYPPPGDLPPAGEIPPGATPPPPPAPPSGQPPYTAPLTPLTESEERTWAMLAHLSILVNLVTGFLGPVVPLVIYAAYKDRSRYVAYQSLQAFVFQMLWWIAAGVLAILAWTVSGVLAFILIGCLLMPLALLISLIPVAALVYGVFGAIETNAHHDFRYWLIGDWLRGTLIG